MGKVNAKLQAENHNRFIQHPYQTIALICFILYAQILTFSLVHFDDHGFVLMAADTLKLSNIPQFFKHSVFWVLGDTTQNYDVFYRPLQNVIYAICNTIASKQPWIYHFFGLLFHIITCCVLFRFLKELKYHASIALVFTLIYTVHPALTQAVAWIPGIGDQMATIFSLLSVLFFIRLISENKFDIKYFAFHLLTFTCALFSKEVSVMIVLICLFYFFFLGKTKSYKNLLLVSAGWIFMLIIYFLFRKNALLPTNVNMLESITGSIKENSLLVLEYFEKIFLPYRLSPIPSREDVQLLIGGILLIAFFLLLIIRKRFTPLTIFGLTWFAVFLFPTFIQQNPKEHFFIFEHRLYLPLIGILIVLIELLNLHQINFNSTFQKYGFSLLLILLFATTFSHSRTFKDPYTFYDKAISSSPKSVIAYNGYGKLLLEDKKYEEAIQAFKKSYEYKSNDLQTTGKIAEIYLKNLNNPTEAITWFKKTLDIDPNSIEAAVSIGDAYFNFLHDTTNAITAYNNALKINPQNEFALANMGVIYAIQGKNEEARNFLSRSLNTNPKNLVSLKWMAISYFNEGKIAEAMKYLLKGYENYPMDIDLQRNLMICYYKLNDFGNTQKFALEYSKSNNPIPAEIENYLRIQNR